jgi:hypothetical protein
MLLYLCWLVLLGDKERTPEITELILCACCDFSKNVELFKGRKGHSSCTHFLCQEFVFLTARWIAPDDSLSWGSYQSVMYINCRTSSCK